MDMPRKIAIMLVLVTAVVVGSWLLTVGARGPGAIADPPGDGVPVVDASGPNSAGATPALDAGEAYEQSDDGEDDDAYEHRYQGGADDGGVEHEGYDDD